jgi:hypothetical protein
MPRIGQSKNEDKEENLAPKLNAMQLADISRQYLTYGKGNINKLLVLWKAARLDDRGRVEAILDHSEWYSRNEVNKNEYERFEPIKGIRYMGQGSYTFMPYSWCTEWLSKWSLWVGERAKEGNEEAKRIVGTTKLIDLKQLHAKN